MRERIASAAKEAGRDSDALTLAYHLEIRVDENAPAQAGAVVGSADSVVEQLAGFIDLGFTALNLTPVVHTAADGLEQVERIAAEILPAIRHSSAARPAPTLTTGAS